MLTNVKHEWERIGIKINPSTLERRITRIYLGGLDIRREMRSYV